MSSPATDALRAIASRMEGRAVLPAEAKQTRDDAAALRSLADAIDEARRPRSRREIEGDRPPSLWRRMVRRWTRRF